MIALDVDSSVSQEECSHLALLAKGKTVLEVGSWLGRSTIAMASEAVRVHSVDWHKGDPHSGGQDTLVPFIRNLERHGVRDKVVIHAAKLEDVAPVFRAAAFDLVFLDAFHSRKAVEDDIAMIMPMLAPSGRLAFHDYGRAMAIGGIPFGVTEAVDAFVKREGAAIAVIQSLAVVEF